LKLHNIPGSVFPEQGQEAELLLPKLPPKSIN